MPLIHIIAGARPNFMKIAPIIRALEARLDSGGTLRYRLVHTGQHYDSACRVIFASWVFPSPRQFGGGFWHTGRANGSDYGALREAAAG